MIEYTISMTWDEDAGVWIAESEEIPGLILESSSFDTLLEQVKSAVPDLLKTPSRFTLCFKAERQAIVA